MQFANIRELNLEACARWAGGSAPTGQGSRRFFWVQPTAPDVQICAHSDCNSVEETEATGICYKSAQTESWGCRMGLRVEQMSLHGANFAQGAGQSMDSPGSTSTRSL